jgi:DNA polymerase theta
MRGRAGRKGKDEVGETYLCCHRKDLESVVDLMHAELPQIYSCLISDKRRIQRAILEIIAIRLASSQETLDDYISKTMLSYSADADSIQRNVRDSLADLQSMGFITVDSFSNYQATQLGKAIVASAFDPEDGVFIHKELKLTLQAFVMDGDMHVLYNFTPVYDLGGTSVNWRVFWNEMEQLDDSSLRVMSFLGVKPTVVNKM